MFKLDVIKGFLFRHQMDTDGSEDRAISEFESPQQVLPQQYQHFQQGYFDNSSQNIDDASVSIYICINQMGHEVY